MIFDFDGVLVDSEPIHFVGFAEVLRSVGMELSREQYYRLYLGYDDRDCLTAAMRDRGMTPTEPLVSRMIADKTRLVRKMLVESVKPLPGAVELARSARLAGVPTAICSGALREEIELALSAIGATEDFPTIVSAEDVSRGKPDPEGFRLAFDRLQRRSGRALDPRRSVVVEDSPAGIQAAKAAGMKVLAVATSYPPGNLADADHVVGLLTEATLASLAKIVEL